jgi:hypothetical protein
MKDAVDLQLPFQPSAGRNPNAHSQETDLRVGTNLPRAAPSRLQPRRAADGGLRSSSPGFWLRTNPQSE